MKYILMFIVFTASALFLNAFGTEKNNKSDFDSRSETQQLQDFAAITESKNFIFYARVATPMNARNINLTSEYNVRVSNDSVFSYLIYQGMSHSAVFGGTENPMIFNLPFSNYKTKKTKNGYLVKLSIKNGTDHLNFSFHISESGSTNLNVSSINRQPMSYSGEISGLEMN